MQTMKPDLVLARETAAFLEVSPGKPNLVQSELLIYT